MRTANTKDIVRAVEENQLDLGLVTMPIRGRAFAVTPLIEDELVVIGPADDHALPAVVTPGALGTLPLVYYESGGDTRHLVEEWFGQAGVAVRPIMELGSVEATKELVAAGLGYAILPRMAVPPGMGPMMSGGPPRHG